MDSTKQSSFVHKLVSINIIKGRIIINLRPDDVHVEVFNYDNGTFVCSRAPIECNPYRGDLSKATEIAFSSEWRGDGDGTHKKI